MRAFRRVAEAWRSMGGSALLRVEATRRREKLHPSTGELQGQVAGIEFVDERGKLRKRREKPHP